MRDRLFLGVRHRYFGRLSLEAVDHPLQTLDLLLLCEIVLLLLFIIRFFAHDKIRIVPGIALRSSVFDLIDHVHDMIEKHPVMRDDNHRLRIILQISLQPLYRCNVQMVRRLVEKQDIRLGEEQLDKGDLRLLSAGEVAQRLHPLLLGEAEFTDQHVALLLKVIAAVPGKGFLHRRVTRDLLFGMIVLQFRCCFRKPPLALIHRREDLADLLLERDLRILEGDLPEVSDLRIARSRNMALLPVKPLCLDLARDQLQKRRFAAAVATDDRDLLGGSDLKLYIVQDEVAAVGNRSV